MRLVPVALEGRFVRLDPVSEVHREGLRAVFDADVEAQQVMSTAAFGPYFDRWWTGATTDPARIAHAVVRRADGAVVGTSSFLNIRPEHDAVEVGWTFLAPEVRGGPVNPECKLLLMDHAFGAGARRVEYLIDARNQRSQAAVRKLGAVQEGVLRKHKLTWTGHVRDTVVLSIVDDEWPAARARLEARLAAAS
ncbi:MAG: GNAT family N-acetyltransferase [Caulobacteraceae bacterium]|nr:GNAT family N-acetyltransferase [Caulobacteraceae bacterium]